MQVDFLALLQVIYQDACSKCVADVSDLRDLLTIKSRVEKEGLSFLTITLPTFSKDFERSLADGCIDSALFRGFRKCGAIPSFLKGMLSLIFDQESGRIINDESSTIPREDIPTIVESVRQICTAFKKLEMPCTLQRNRDALREFVETEVSFESFQLQQEDVKEFQDVSFILWSRLLRNFRVEDCEPQHGPGATSERVMGNSKYAWTFWHDRLDHFFPLVGGAFPIGIVEDPINCREIEKVTILPENEELPVRVTLVPKTLKRPRVIAIEPCCMQYAQQGIRDWIYSVIESSDIARGHINFRDQSVNQSLALTSSSDGRLATIDLSDASDRVPLELALDMFNSNQDLREAIAACRSTHALLPDGSTVGPLKKFASMGSALCFPVEAMYFYTICVMARLKEADLPVSWKNCFAVSRDIYVYGDDIVVPVDSVTVVFDYLRKYNCKVNASKTFWTGRFRESCGVDSYDGQVVTPVYVHHAAPKDRREASELISWVATSNLFYKKGYWRTAHLMITHCETVLGPLPYVSEDSAALGRQSFLGYRTVERWNDDLDRPEVKGWVMAPVIKEQPINGYAALSKSLKKLARRQTDVCLVRGLQRRSVERLYIKDGKPVFGVHGEHLDDVALHGAVTLKRRWVPLYGEGILG